MSVIIGHASIDENKKIKNGQAGDQTGKEVCTREWYNKNWDVVLRCDIPELVEKMAIACERGCANNNIGYDQNQRNSLRVQAYKNNFNLSKISAPCETDCSAFMTVCAECAGVAIPYNNGNAPTTRTMRKAFLSTGLFHALTESKYRNSSDYLKRGDILVKEGSHTVMVLSNGKSTQNTSSVDIDQLARDCINGKYGSGEARKKALGNLYSIVQKRVNELLNG